MSELAFLIPVWLNVEQGLEKQRITKNFFHSHLRFSYFLLAICIVITLNTIDDVYYLLKNPIILNFFSFPLWGEG